MDKLIGISKSVKSLFKFIDDSKVINMNEFFLNSLVRGYQRFSSVHEIRSVFSGPGYVTYDDTFYLRKISGYNYFDINSALKDRWAYDENGDIDRKKEFLQIASKISRLISENRRSFGDFVVYRDVSLSFFKDYGIDSLDDLRYLEGQFLYDKGFISTSLLEDNSSFGKEREKENKCNVKIEYMIPREFNDGVYLGENSIITYQPDKYEYLINASNLARVSLVKIGDDETAVLRAIIIPKSLYDDYYRKNDEVKK